MASYFGCFTNGRAPLRDIQCIYVSDHVERYGPVHSGRIKSGIIHLRARQVIVGNHAHVAPGTNAQSSNV